jgi:hypothetical protein
MAKGFCVTDVDLKTKTVTLTPYPEWRRYWPVVFDLFGVKLCNRLEIRFGGRKRWGFVWNVGKTPKRGGRFYYSWVLNLWCVWIAWDAHAIEKLMAEKRHSAGRRGAAGTEEGGPA